jgi:hypothetical protein
MPIVFDAPSSCYAKYHGWQQNHLQHWNKADFNYGQKRHIYGISPAAEYIDGHPFNPDPNAHSCCNHQAEGSTIWIYVPIKAAERNPANYKNHSD